MNRKPVYETPAAELILVSFEENILSNNPFTGRVLAGNPFAGTEEEEL